jgi:hypothetical protein
MAILKIHFNFNNNHDVNKVINECLKNKKYVLEILKIHFNFNNNHDVNKVMT